MLSLTNKKTYQLVCQQEDSLERELSAAKVEEILQTGSEEIHDHGVIVAFCSKPADKRDADSACQRFVNSCFVFQLGVLCFDRLQFDGDFFIVDNAGSY